MAAGTGGGRARGHTERRRAVPLYQVRLKRSNRNVAARATLPASGVRERGVVGECSPRSGCVPGMWTQKSPACGAFSFSRAEPVVRPFSNSPPTAGRPFDVAPLKSGGRILGLIPDFVADPTVPSRDEIRVVLNWTEELGRRVP